MEYLIRLCNVIIFMALWIGVPLLIDKPSAMWITWLPALFIIMYLEDG